MEFEQWPLHDAVLHEVRIEWRASTCTILLAAFTIPGERARPHAIRFDGVTSVSVPHANPWGPSVFINGQRRGDDGAYLIEIQSGDVLVIHAAAARFEPE